MSYGQTTYLVENQLTAEFCATVRVDVVVFNCGQSCATPYPSCYSVSTVWVGPGSNAGVNLDPNDWVGRIDVTGDCTRSTFNTCTVGSTTFEQADKGGGCNDPPNCTVVTIAGDATNGAQIY